MKEWFTQNDLVLASFGEGLSRINGKVMIVFGEALENVYFNAFNFDSTSFSKPVAC